MERERSISSLVSPRQRISSHKPPQELAKSPTRTNPTRKHSEHQTTPITKSPRSRTTSECKSAIIQKPLMVGAVTTNSLDRDEIVGRKKTKIRIKTCHKTFVCALIEKGLVEHSLTKLEEEYIWVRFELGSENIISIKSCYGRYLSADKGGKLVTSRARKQLEVLTIERLPNTENKVAIKTAYGEYMCALPGGSLQCNRFGPQTWEIFEIEEEPFAPPVYGGNLNDIVVYQLKGGNYSQVPRVLEFLAEQICRLDGHSTEGIWRISGNGATVMKCRNEIQKGNFDSHFENCHDAATLFKLFLRELSEPVFPDEYYTTSIRLAEEHNTTGINELIRKFDNINLKVIQFVINFLRSFLKPEFISCTMMTANNLATVFAPTLLRCPSDNPLLQITVSSSEVKFVLTLLENFPDDLREEYPVVGRKEKIQEVVKE